MEKWRDPVYRSKIMYCIGIINEGVVKGRMHTGPSRCSVIGRSSSSGDSLLLNRQREVPLWFGGGTILRGGA